VDNTKNVEKFCIRFWIKSLYATGKLRYCQYSDWSDPIICGRSR